MVRGLQRRCHDTACTRRVAKNCNTSESDVATACFYLVRTQGNELRCISRRKVPPPRLLQVVRGSDGHAVRAEHELLRPACLQASEAQIEIGGKNCFVYSYDGAIWFTGSYMHASCSPSIRGTSVGRSSFGLISDASLDWSIAPSTCAKRASVMKGRRILRKAHSRQDAHELEPQYASMKDIESYSKLERNEQ